MRKILSFFLALILISSVIVAVPTQAATYKVGDLNSDTEINSIDLNYLSRVMSGSFTPADERCADINHDGSINTTDLNYFKRYLLGQFTITQPSNGVSVSEYTVVYPVEYTPYELYAAEILVDTVKDKYGIELNMVTDAADESDKEILIGKTNRASSTTTAVFENNQYLCKITDNDIVINGKDYMIGGGVAALCYDYIENGAIKTDIIPTVDTVCDYVAQKADSVILMIGDGMGINHIKYTANVMRKGNLRQYNYKGFIAEQFPNQGEASTVSLSDMLDDGSYEMRITDSAASSTALSTGWKTQNGKLGINAVGDSVINVRELAHSLGLKTGVMSTEVATGATPSGFTVHIPDRDETDEINAAQQALIANGEIDYLKGAVYDNLLDETKIALDTISTDSNGFFMMIEEAYIDKACDALYGGDGTYKTTDIAIFVHRFNNAIQYAATFTAARPGTILIITADHETGGLNVSGTSTSYGQHTDRNVPVFAIGAGTEIFNGTTVINTDIPKFIASVYGIDEFGGDYGIDFTDKKFGDFVFPAA